MLEGVQSGCHLAPPPWRTLCAPRRRATPRSGGEGRPVKAPAGDKACGGVRLMNSGNQPRPGLIFISHSSQDKAYVERITGLIPKSHTFYDIQSINPAEDNVDAMERGVMEADV